MVESERDRTRSPEYIQVGIAEYAVTTDDRPLKTSGIGSCVAVAIHDADAGVSGLLHFMLPESTPRADGDSTAKFADTGIEALIAEFEARGGAPARSWATLVGGATMLGGNSFGRAIGDQNVEAARTILDTYGISIRAVDVGGSAGRTVTLDPATGEVLVRSASRTSVLQ